MSLPVSGSLQRNVTKAVLRSQKNPDVRFPFEYNPTEISISHNAEGLSDPVGKENAEDSRSIVASIATRGSTRLVLSALTFTGSSIQEKVRLLMDWVVEETVTRADGTTEKGRREPLRFQWGSTGVGFDMEVELMRFDCTYTRFARNGLPIRAEIRNLTLHVLSPSGGASAASGGTPPALSYPAPTPGVPAGLPPGSKPNPNTDVTAAMAKGERP
ncbi:hypothetical protein EES43_02985 [Streptomyces sp. ADI96-02]|uniref:CIS tube protein n=1 Tax=unclassified Streptomyces TaxID=2593676 RepID=UPI000F555068|nr:hypothetical protein [Streptomyces sp. ADI96-02]RPK67548.1 hypothetical protein EES43_02985 [Streptomyces sp. ADI96-02]